MISGGPQISRFKAGTSSGVEAPQVYEIRVHVGPPRSEQSKACDVPKPSEEKPQGTLGCYTIGHELVKWIQSEIKH